MYCSGWTERAPYENILRAMVVLRLLLRDPQLQYNFVCKLDGLRAFSLVLKQATNSYLGMDDSRFIVNILSEMTSKCCAVLWCAVVCCGVVCCAVLCCAVLCCAGNLPSFLPDFPISHGTLNNQ